ncbi:MAG: hypothetical protein KC449_29680, partial [Anaerolineales bacterium]|nr:hypothetical protein [Anaerolineales bacterium]
MRLRTFILLILVLILIAAVALVLLGNSGIGPLASVFGGGDNTAVTDNDTADSDEGSTEPLQPPPTATPGLEDVIVAKVNIPVGTMLTDELLEVQRWPRTNIALQGGYTFTDTTRL